MTQRRSAAGRDGVLPVDKPEGPTSHDAVAAARRALRERRIGHTGTLDPFATGLLLLCVGRATRLSEYLTDLPKTYRAVARLGAATDTDDLTGQVVSRAEPGETVETARVEAALLAQVGARMQRPPAYSAKKVRGERAYARARRGAAVVAEPVQVRIHAIRVERIEWPEVAFEVECSAGTYIRAIARDLGEELGVGGHLTALRRTAIGRFGVDQALPLERLDDPDAVERAWVPPLAALAHLPRLDVDEPTAHALGHGRATDAGSAPAGLVAVAHAGELLALGEVAEGRLRPRKVFGDA